MTTVSLPARSEHAPSLQDPRARAVAPPPEVESVRLLQGQRELLIRHGNECYRLRHTRNDKLILTK
jgi:hemin uptake protein HemP